jgi:hypothetical protein
MASTTDRCSSNSARRRRCGRCRRRRSIARAACSTCSLVRPEYENMPTCSRTKPKSRPGAFRASFSTSSFAHFLDAHAHAGQLVFPQLAQFRGRQHGGDDLAAVHRRVRIVGAHHALQLRQQARRLFGEAATTDSAPTRSPYSENDFENEFDTSSGPPASTKRRTTAPSSAMPVAEALVGHVQEGHQAVLAHGLDHLAPLVGGQVGAGRVVAAGVQHDDRAFRHGFAQVGQHAVEVDAVGGGVVVGVVVDGEAGRFRTARGGFPSSGR